MSQHTTKAARAKPGKPPAEAAAASAPAAPKLHSGSQPNALLSRSLAPTAADTRRAMIAGLALGAGPGGEACSSPADRLRARRNRLRHSLRQSRFCQPDRLVGRGDRATRLERAAEALCAVGARLARDLRAGDLVARVGGDEFVLLLQEHEGDFPLASVLERIRRRIEQPLHLHGRSIRIGCSIGLAAFPADGGDLDALLRSADRAMYRQKALHRAARPPAAPASASAGVSGLGT